MAPAPRASRSMSSVARSSREGNAPIAPRIAIAGVIGAVIIGILVLRLWALTVLGGAEYAERADSNVIRKLPVVAPRGSILDRRGNRIVVNVEMQQVVVDLQDIEGERLDQVVEDLGRVLAPRPSAVDEVTTDIREAIDQAPPGAVEPVVVASEVRRPEVIHYLAEHAADFPGVDVRQAFKRQYRHGRTAAHILGQIGAVDQADLDARPALQPIDRIGKSGLEKRYDEYLRGVNGYEAVKVDAAGVRTDAYGIRGLPPTNGRNLVTTIDLPLQKASERALEAAVRKAAGTAKGRDANAGAVVAIDPKTGEVLTLASYPSYDPNVFTSRDPRDQRVVERLLNPHNKGQPLLNRAIAGEYPPASTYKPITALAAFDRNYVRPDTLIECPPFLDILGTRFKNHVDRHLGSHSVVEALETSCDTYFYELALFFYNDPKSPLASWSRKFGLGSATGLDLPGEASGLIPTPKWKRTVDSELWDRHPGEREWRPGDSINMSIGQGNTLVTPIQMTNVFATLANGGTLREPRLAKRIESVGGREQVALPRGDEVDLQIDPGDLAAVVQGLVAVNNGPNGTARGVFDGFEVSTAGKTGTGEKTNQTDLAWYCGFAPVEDPTIAACAFVDGGGGGSTTAAPVVLEMFRQWFKQDGGDVHGPGGTD